ncbi:unnamed protein product [Linum tenue]|uniref:Uncharacterized protein n=1 Tax=Linum tenue TaxID=586396 RepID=A0AAV0P908_9ROSI|nr:unnamed protein product [Linum tenue]
MMRCVLRWKILGLHASRHNARRLKEIKAPIAGWHPRWSRRKLTLVKSTSIALGLYCGSHHGFASISRNDSSPGRICSG